MKQTFITDERNWNRMAKKYETPNKLRPLAYHGTIFKRETDGQAVGDCVFCGKVSHFYADVETGQWDCKTCGKKGNIISYLTKYSQMMFEGTEPSALKKLAKLRGLPAKAFRGWKIFWDGMHWCLPATSQKKTVRDIRRYNPKKKYMQATPGCKVQLYGTSKLNKLKKGGTIYLCEGEWDCIAMSWMLKIAKKKLSAAVGVPGANTFKDEWCEFFKGRHVILCYDNDTTGRSGIIRAYEHLYNVASSIQVIVWPDNCKSKYDISDYYRDHRKKNLKSPQILKKLQRHIQSIDSYIDNLPENVDVPQKSTPKLTCLSDVEPEDVEWLWANRIPLGKLSVIAGDPGLGKSFLTLFIAACISNGKQLPDTDTSIETGSVVLLSAEDGLADTIRPRLDDAGADPSKVFALEGVNIAKEKYTKEFNLSDDLKALEQAIEQTNDVRLVVIDPITAYMGSTDSHKNAEVRKVLAPLSTLAEKYRVAVIAVTHLNKKDSDKMIYRTMGSLAFVAAARSAWYVTQDKADKDRRLFVPGKTNLSVDPTGLAFRIMDGVVEFEEDSFEFNPADESTKKSSAMDKATEMLLELLNEGPVSCAKITAKGLGLGISPETLKRAKKKLNIKSIKEKGSKLSKWNWHLPGEEK